MWSIARRLIFRAVSKFMRRNHAKLGEIMALAITRELKQEDGHWPTAEAKVLELTVD